MASDVIILIYKLPLHSVMLTVSLVLGHSRKANVFGLGFEARVLGLGLAARGLDLGLGFGQGREALASYRVVSLMSPTQFAADERIFMKHC